LLAYRVIAWMRAHNGKPAVDRKPQPTVSAG
jgi:hypothetical protein